MKFANSFLTSALVAASISSVWSSPVALDRGNSTVGVTSGPRAVNLLSTTNYVALAQTGISTVPPSVITGNIGVSPAGSTFITGFSLTQDATNVFSSSPQVVGRVYASSYSAPTPSSLISATNDVTTAYNDAAGRLNPNYLNLGAGGIGGRVLLPGLYKWTSSVGILSDVILLGLPTDTWIFQISGTLTVASGKSVILIGGLPRNVFWQVAGGATIGTTAHFEGVLLSKTSAVLQTGASMTGRILAQTAITLEKAVLTQA